MNAHEYAKKNAMPVEAVITMIRSRELVGYFENDTWVVGEKYPNHSSDAITGAIPDSKGSGTEEYPNPASSGDTDPIYRRGLGESLLEFLGFIFLIFGIVGGLFVFTQLGGTIALMVLVQGVLVFAVLNGLASIIKLLKFVSEKLDG